MEWFEVSKVLDRSKYTVMRVSTFSMWFVMESTTFNADSSVEFFFTESIPTLIIQIIRNKVIIDFIIIYKLTSFIML